MNADFSGLGDLMVYFMNWLVNDFSVRTIDSTTIPALLDIIAPIWNPIWAAVGSWLEIRLGF